MLCCNQTKDDDIIALQDEILDMLITGLDVSRWTEDNGYDNALMEGFRKALESAFFADDQPPNDAQENISPVAKTTWLPRSNFRYASKHMSNGLPLVSISILCYKHEKFIRESIKSALSQTYNNIEIVLYDDRSPDRTFEFACDEAGKYKGIKRIVMHQNPNNIGIIKNYNAAWSRCSGDIIVVQCGDDRSRPTRVQSIVDALSQDASIDYVFSDVAAIDEDGSYAGESVRAWIDWPKDFSLETFVASGAVGGFLGCSAAFRKRVFTKYGPMRTDVLAEDCIMPFRAALEGGLRMIEEPLLEYRVHPTMFSARKFDSVAREDRMYFAKARLGNIEEWMHCLDLSDKATPEIRAQLAACRELRRFDVEGFHSSLLQLTRRAWSALRGGAPWRATLGIFRQHVRDLGRAERMVDR